MGQIGWIRRTTARINLDGVMYTVYEDLGPDGVFTFWTKIENWCSDLHQTMRALETELRNQGPYKSMHRNKKRRSTLIQVD